MDYFWIRQDERYLYLPRIRHFITKYKRSDFTIENAHKISERNVVFVDSEKLLDYVDVIDRQLFLISEGVREVFEMYDPSITYKTFCLLNNARMELKLYYSPIIPQIDGTTEPNRFREGRRTGMQLILLRERLNRPILRVNELSPDGVVIRLDVAESLLRRGLYKMNLTRQVIR